MAPETSQFESCEMLGAFLASTPLVEETWRVCRGANADAQRSFSVKALGSVSYVAFSGVQAVARSRDMVALDEKVFGSFSREGAVMVDAALLQIFLSFYASHHFQQKMLEVLEQSKSVVFGGHSVGGAIASLSALWLLSYIRTASPQHPISVLCITFGSPMLGNHSFSQAIIQERWDGNFCHVVAPHDLVPRLLSAPFASDMFTTSPYLPSHLSDEEKARLFNAALASMESRLRKDEDDQESWPFGNYMFCSDKGAVCLDNATAILKFLYLTMAAASSPSCSVDDHLKYEDYVAKLSWHYLKMRHSTADAAPYASSNEAGVAFALQTLGISSHQEAAARRCLAGARGAGWPRSLNNAKMAVSLGKINPCRAEIEWYKKYCDDCEHQLGYYDSFKRRGASRREFKVNMNRLRLGRFWDQLIEKMETNQLTRDFHKLAKYVNASNFYKLLVEPLEIAEYYRTGKHREKGHYIQHGREKRFKMFDKWWGERVCGDEEATPRSKYANLTQDSCFWARVEEAICFIYDVVAEADAGRRLMLLHEIDKFEKYASGMVERMEVSVDVLAKNSSYNLFRQEWEDLRARLPPPPPPFPRFQDGMVQ